MTNIEYGEAGRAASAVERLVMRLRRYNEWRRGGELEQPAPAEIGRDIEAAADTLELMDTAIRQTLYENGHLADGEFFTLIHLKRAIGGE